MRQLDLTALPAAADVIDALAAALGDRLPADVGALVDNRMRQCYRTATSANAERTLRALAAELDERGYVSAAATLRAGVRETCTVIDWHVPGPLHRLLHNTVAIKSVVETARRVLPDFGAQRPERMTRDLLNNPS